MCRWEINPKKDNFDIDYKYNMIVTYGLWQYSEAPRVLCSKQKKTYLVSAI